MSLRTWWRGHRQRVELARQPDPVWTPGAQPRVPPPRPVEELRGGDSWLDRANGPVRRTVWDQMPVPTEPFRIKEN